MGPSEARPASPGHAASRRVASHRADLSRHATSASYYGVTSRRGKRHDVRSRDDAYHGRFVLRRSSLALQDPGAVGLRNALA